MDRGRRRLQPVPDQALRRGPARGRSVERRHLQRAEGDRRLYSAARRAQRREQAIERDDEQRSYSRRSTWRARAMHSTGITPPGYRRRRRASRRAAGWFAPRAPACSGPSWSRSRTRRPTGRAARGRGHRLCARRLRGGRSTRRARAVAARAGPRASESAPTRLRRETFRSREAPKARTPAPSASASASGPEAGGSDPHGRGRRGHRSRPSHACAEQAAGTAGDEDG